MTNCKHKNYTVLKSGHCVDGADQENFWEKRQCNQCGKVWTEEYI